jgi:hypothetical protein
MQLRVQRLEEHRWIDVALVIRAEHDRRPGEVLPAVNTETDAGTGEGEPDARVAERVQSPLPPEGDCNDEPGRPRYGDVAEHDQVSYERTEGDEEGQRVKCTKKRPEDKLPGGEEG